jgi:lysophospholipase L1-like esterase
LVYARMAASNSSTLTSIALSNQAAGGNRILKDGLGPSVLSRIDRDVLAHPSVKYAMIFEGVNDIGTADPTTANQTVIYNRLISAYRQIATRIHDFGIPLFAATITPFSAPDNNVTLQVYTSPVREVTRQKVNTFIRTSGIFDAVFDFDALLRNQSYPAQLQDALLANTFDLSVFDRFQGGVSSFI